MELKAVKEAADELIREIEQSLQKHQEDVLIHRGAIDGIKLFAEKLLKAEVKEDGEKV